MKKIAIPTLGLVLLASVAFALDVKKPLVHIFEQGVKLGSSGTTISDSFAASTTIDFASATDACDVSSDITVTGAAANDVCVVGAPTTADEDSWFSCFVSAANTVKVKHCAHGTVNPASATYTVRVFDP